MFSIEAAKIFEILVRVVLVYLSCFILLRVSGRRELAELGAMDLLTMLLLSEAVSPAITGNEQSITGGVIAAATLLGVGVAFSWLSARSKRLDALIQGTAKILIVDGRVNAKTLRQLRITDEDLRSKLHEHGLLNVKDVARAYVEADGQITIIKREELESSRARFHAHA